MSNPIERIAARNNRTTSRERNRENPQVPNQVVTTESPQFHDKVVYINRCAKVVKGGRRFSFSALIVSGDQKGRVGIGFGKANEVSDAIRKATDAAHKRMVEIKIANNTIPHEVIGNFGGGCVLLKPASPGTGVIAGGGVRAVVEAAGIRDVLAKSLGSKNPANVVKATLDALLKLRHRNEIFQIRGKKIRSKSPNESSNPATNKQSE
ncbi:MAG: 30S ribosomal protein S5 [Chthoniobacterales bacterium]|nr:30S ribosomal protein S5 [Chthoniobacterales bacterium]